MRKRPSESAHAETFPAVMEAPAMGRPSRSADTVPTTPPVADSAAKAGTEATEIESVRASKKLRGTVSPPVGVSGVGGGKSAVVF